MLSKNRRPATLSPFPKSPFLGHTLPVLVLLALILLFFLPVVTGEKGFYAGDHKDQHYPWWVFMVEQLKAGEAPLWTNLIASGFPLMAEGQIGFLYPLNWLFAFIGTPEQGYNFSILLHFFLGGIFFYGYCVHHGLSKKSAFLATILYSFGSARAGYYYNITSQRVLIWFPLCLFFTDHIMRRARTGAFTGLSLAIALILLAGYQQYAAYACLLIFIYALLQFLFFPCHETSLAKFSSPRIVSFSLILLALLCGFIISLPQTLPFIQLLPYSSRLGVAETFAYVGSANPLGLVTLFYPDWDDFFKTELFVGILTLFFVLLPFYSFRNNNKIKLALTMLFISYALALGEYNPLYILFVKLTHYGGRVPSKFLYFTSTFMALLGGWGWHYFENFHSNKDPDLLQRAKRLFYKLCLGALAFMALASVGLRIFKEQTLAFGKFLVNQCVLNNPAHPHSPEYYYEKVHRFYDSLLIRFTPTHFYTLTFSILILVAMRLLHYLLKPERRPVQNYIFSLAFILLELYVYAQHGVFGNLRDSSYVKPDSKIVEYVQATQGYFRLHAVVTDGLYDDFPIYPNYNMALNIPVLGGYSPLMVDNYLDYLGSLGGINNSLRVTQSDPKALVERSPILNFLAVKYILAKQGIVPPTAGFKELIREREFVLYLNPNAYQGVYWLGKEQVTESGHRFYYFDEKRLSRRNELPVTIREWGQNHISVKTHASAPGYLVLASLFYPGWIAHVNGSERKICPFNKIFMGIELEEGEQLITFHYSYWRALKELMPKSD